jgi:DNA polymerase V
METLRTFTPRLEVYSIDEAFLDLSGVPAYQLASLANTIRETVVKATGIPTSIGIAPTKTLAKLASQWARRHYRESGVCFLDTAEKMEELLRSTSIEEVWGIGPRHAQRLKARGFHSAWELRNASENWVRQQMTVVGQRLVKELKGIACVPFEDKAPSKKNISIARSFGHLLTDIGDIKEAVATYASLCAEKLRKQGSCARALHIFLQTNPYRKHDKQYYNAVTIPLPTATNTAQEIMFYAACGINLLYRTGYHYLKAGVTVKDLVPEGQAQQALFTERLAEREGFLVETIDQINRSWGRDLVRFALQGDGKDWKLKQEHLSPCYTTRLDQVITIKI